jgi:hypothetical protein
VAAQAVIAGRRHHAGIQKKFTTADKRIIERDIGFAILTAEGYSTIDEIVFAEESDIALLSAPLLGVRTLEGFSVMVDNIGHRFVATVSMACNMYEMKCPQK